MAAAVTNAGSNSFDPLDGLVPFALPPASSKTGEAAAACGGGMAQPSPARDIPKPPLLRPMYRLPVDSPDSTPSHSEQSSPFGSPVAVVGSALAAAMGRAAPKPPSFAPLYANANQGLGGPAPFNSPPANKALRPPLSALGARGIHAYRQPLKPPATPDSSSTDSSPAASPVKGKKPPVPSATTAAGKAAQAYRQALKPPATPDSSSSSDNSPAPSPVKGKKPPMPPMAAVAAGKAMQAYGKALKPPMTPGSSTDNSPVASPAKPQRVPASGGEPGSSAVSPLKKKKGADTPPSVRRFERDLAKFDSECDLVKAEREAMAAALKDLGKVGTPKRRELCERLISPVKPKESPGSHKKAAQNLHDGAQWVASLGNSLNALHGGSPVLRIVDMEHIVSSEDGMGFHFCPDQKGLVNIRVNPETGVFVADFAVKDGLKTKQSTFFPLTIKQEAELLMCVQTAKELFSSGNQRFCQITVGDKTIYAIKYLQGVLVRSCFPIFFVGDLDGADAEISIAGLAKVRKHAVVAMLVEKRPAEIKKCILFTDTHGRILLDLSALLGVAAIKNGICFWVTPQTIDYRVIIGRDLFGAKPSAAAKPNTAGSGAVASTALSAAGKPGAAGESGAAVSVAAAEAVVNLNKTVSGVDVVSAALEK